MLVDEREISVPKAKESANLLEHFSKGVSESLAGDEMPVRFVVTRTGEVDYQCELGTLSGTDDLSASPQSSLFDFRRRDYESVESFNAVLVIPTGIGAEIGGHSGDGGPVARLLAAACDSLITHPNVVNASDINELPENALYVEGSIISRLLMGTVALQKVRSNRVMLVVDKHEDRFFHEAAVNSASAARAAFGLDCPLVVEMTERILMRSIYSSSGRAVGRIEHLQRVCEVLDQYRSQFDAVALSTLVEVSSDLQEDYYRLDAEDIVNPWGGAEAMLTHAISLMYDVPSAHSPMMASKETLNWDVGVVDPRKAAEVVSTTYLHSVLKGLHRSPRIVNNPPTHGQSGLLTVADISCLIIPDGCVGLPTLAALEQGIPVIAVKENKNRMQNDLRELPFTSRNLFIVDNYLEAAGLMSAIKSGVLPEAVRRPLAHTVVCDTETAEDGSVMADLDSPLSRGF